VIQIFALKTKLRAIALKKKQGGGKNSPWPPRTKLGFFQPTRQKRVFSLPPQTQNSLFSPLGHVCFLVPPQTVLSNPVFPAKFYPLWDSFLSILPPPRTAFFSHFTRLGQLFSPILPPRTIYFDNFTPLRHFSENVTPFEHLFLRPPRTKICSFLPPGQKQIIFSTPPRTGWFDPLVQKGHFLPLPVF